MKTTKKNPRGRPKGRHTVSRTVSFSHGWHAFMEGKRNGLAIGKWIESRIPMK